MQISKIVSLCGLRDQRNEVQIFPESVVVVTIAYKGKEVSTLSCIICIIVYICWLSTCWYSVYI